MDNLDEMELKLLRKMNQEKDAEITSLKEENERLREKASRSHIQKDRDYWQKKAMDMLHGNFTQCCSYCGFEAPPPNGWEELQKHIEECPEHPLPKLRQSLAAAWNELDELRKVVWWLEKQYIYEGNPWVLWDDVAKANGLDIEALQRSMGK